MRYLFEGDAYLKIVPDEFTSSIFLYKSESFMITRAKISAVRANYFVVVEQFIVFPGYTEFLE